jgi:hypothetical protein
MDRHVTKVRREVSKGVTYSDTLSGILLGIAPSNIPVERDC